MGRLRKYIAALMLANGPAMRAEQSRISRRIIEFLGSRSPKSRRCCRLRGFQRQPLGQEMLRNLFGRKATFDDAAKLEFASAIADMLELQRMMAGGSSFEDASGNPKGRAIGYVYGYVDAALRTINQDMNDMSIGVPVLFHVIRKLWPDRVNKYMLFLTKNLQSDGLIHIGMMHGGQQYLDFRKPENHGNAAMGLARFMIEGDKSDE